MAETAPRTSPRPESREQAAEQKRRDREMQEAFGDMEFRQDLETKGFSDPLVRLGYGAMEGEGEGARILPTPLNAAGVFAIEDNPRLNQWREERGLERGKPGDVYTTGEFQGSNTVWAHELRHRGLMRLRDAVGQDIDGFVETYMPDAPQRSKNIAGYLLSGGPAEEKLMDFMDRDSPVELNLPLEELSDDSENFDELDTQSYNDIKDTILRAAADMNRAAGSPERTVRHEDRVEPEPEKKGFWSRIFGYAEGGLVGRKTRAQMEEENRAAAEQMLPLPHDLPAPSVPLMEMPVDEFLGYLPEITGGNQEQTDFLMREYNRINSLTGGMDSGPSEGYKAIEGTGGFLEKREGDTGWDAVRGVRINPRAGAVGVVQGLEQVATAPGRAALNIMPKADSTNEAFGLASSVAGLGVARAGRGASVVDESTTNIFGGYNARDPGFDSRGNKLPESTGADEMWRFEIDDSDFSVRETAIDQVFNKGRDRDTSTMSAWDSMNPGNTVLKDAVSHEELFNQYPALGDMPLFFDQDMPKSTFGEMQMKTTEFPRGYISLNPNNSPEQNRRTLIHEIQHAVQEEEGFARGTNTLSASMASGTKGREFLEHKRNETIRQLEGAQYDDFAGSTEGFLKLFESLPEDFPDGEFVVGYNRTNLQRTNEQLQAVLNSPLSSAERKVKALNKSHVANRMALEELAFNQSKGYINVDPVTLGPYENYYRGLVDANTDRLEGAITRDEFGEVFDRSQDDFRNIFLSDFPNFIPDETPGMLDLLLADYKTAMGEVEARNTSDRLDFAPAQRAAQDPETTEDTPRAFQWNPRTAFAEGGLVADVSNNAMADYFKAASGMMSEAEFTGKHKISTRDFENRFEEQNNVDISGAESFKEITGISKGDNMRKQMSFFNEGGMATTRRDPVSGNEIPPGSTAENVRDDIPARLSEGEYVVPADVVRYFGVNFFEQLREKAKGGMDEMSTDGRIGGQPAPQQQPRGIDPELAQQITQMAEGGLVDPNNVNMLIDKVVEAAKANPDIQGIFQKRGIMMSAGGLVTGEQPQGSFNAANWGTVGGSYGAPGNSGATPASVGGGFEYVPYTNANGSTMMILFINGAPAQTVPQGYTQGQTYVDPNAAAPAEPTNQNRDRGDRPNRGAMPVGDGQELDFSFGDPLADVDFSDGAAVIDWANTRLSENNNFFGDWGDKAAQLLGATMGGPIGATLARAATKGYGEARDVAVINAAAQVAEQRGDTATAEALRKISGNAVENFGLRGMNFLSEETWSGDNIAADYLERRGELSDTAVSGRSSATGALAGQVAGSGGSSSGGSSGSSSGTSSSAPAPVASVSRSNDNGRNDNNTGDYSGQSGSVASTPTATTTAQAQIAARNAGVSASTSAGLSGSQMAAGSGVGTGANGEDEYGPMYKGGLVSRRYKKK